VLERYNLVIGVLYVEFTDVFYLIEFPHLQTTTYAEQYNLHPGHKALKGPTLVHTLLSHVDNWAQNSQPSTFWQL